MSAKKKTCANFIERALDNDEYLDWKTEIDFLQEAEKIFKSEKEVRDAGIFYIFMLEIFPHEPEEATLVSYKEFGLDEENPIDIKLTDEQIKFIRGFNDLPLGSHLILESLLIWYGKDEFTIDDLFLPMLKSVKYKNLCEMFMPQI
jgi:hypothetical protein